MHGVDHLIGDACLMHEIARHGNLSARTHEADVGQRLTKSLLKYGIVKLVAVAHDKDVVVLVKRQGRCNILVVAQDDLMRAGMQLGPGEFRATVEKCAVEADARQGANRGVPHMSAAKDNGAHGQGHRHHKVALYDAILLAPNEFLARCVAIACQNLACGTNQGNFAREERGFIVARKHQRCRNALVKAMQNFWFNAKTCG